MAIARTNQQAIGYTGTNSYSFSFTTSGSNRLLFVHCASGNNNGDIISGVTYGGVAMTQVHKWAVQYTSMYFYTYVLVNPPLGANNVVISASANGIWAGAASYSGVRQDQNYDALNFVSTGSGYATSLSVPITVANNAMVILFAINNWGSWGAANLMCGTGNGTPIDVTVGGNGYAMLVGTYKVNMWESSPLAITPAGAKTITIALGQNANLAGAAISFAPTIPPTASTQSASSVGAYSATGNGTIVDTGGALCDTRGIEWGTTSGVYTSNNDESGSFSAGAYARSITGLSPNIIYYARARIHNSEGWSYGSEVSFTTPKVAPTVTTQATDLVSYVNARGNGNVSADGGDTITQRGICWGTGHNPTTAGSKTTASGTIGSFIAAITGLSRNTIYYARAYATNSIGTSYGSEVSFKTPDLNFFTLGSPITNVTNRMRWGFFTWN